jgi:hypothetical protein
MKTTNGLFFMVSPRGKIRSISNDSELPFIFKALPYSTAVIESRELKTTDLKRCAVVMFITSNIDTIKIPALINFIGTKF